MERRTNFKKIIILIVVIGILILVVLWLNNSKSISSQNNIGVTPQPNGIIDQNVSSVTPSASLSASYTLEQIAKHKNASDCWIAINGIVVDVTGFIAQGLHNPKIVEGCGRDATADFTKVDKHQGKQVQDLLKQYEIGKLK